MITLDTKSVLMRYGSQAHLSPVNSGSTLFKAAKRAQQTFRPFAIYDIVEKRPPVELMVEGGLPDVREHVVRVDTRAVAPSL